MEEKTITINTNDYARKTANAMTKLLDVEMKDKDTAEKLLLMMLFLKIQGMIFDELFKGEEEVANA